jgi:hypothetical protein
MAQQTFSGVPGTFAAGAVLTAAEQELIRDYMIAQIKEGMTGDTGEILPMIMDLTNNRIVLDAGGLEFSNGSLQTVAAVAGITWSGSTANGLATFGSSSSVVAESTATYDGTTLDLTGSGGGLKLDGRNSSNANNLDDYEEGTWTLSLTTGSGSATVNTSYNTGAYVKVGRLVTITGSCNISAISSPSGGLNLGTLPFAPADLGEWAERAAINVALYWTSSDMNGPTLGTVTAGNTNIYVDNVNGRAARQDAAAFVDTGTYIYVGGSYYAA